MPSGTGSSGDDNIMTPGDAILSAQEVKEDLQGRISGPRATHEAWLFAGSDRGGQRAALLHSLIVIAKLNDVDPQAWLADVLVHTAVHPAHRLDELLP